MITLSYSEEYGDHSKAHYLTIDGDDVELSIHKPGPIEQTTVIHAMPKDDVKWLSQYLLNKSMFLLPQIVEVMMTPRYDFNDVKRELVKL